MGPAGFSPPTFHSPPTALMTSFPDLGLALVTLVPPASSASSPEAQDARAQSVLRSLPFFSCPSEDGTRFAGHPPGP